MGEEKDNSDINFSYPVWILDPVNGTSNLIHSFASQKNSTETTSQFTPSAVSYKDTCQIQVSDTTELSRTLVSFGTSPYDKASLGEKNCETLGLYCCHRDHRRSRWHHHRLYRSTH